jgi:hypothetical protein
MDTAMNEPSVSLGGRWRSLGQRTLPSTAWTKRLRRGRSLFVGATNNSAIVTFNVLSRAVRMIQRLVLSILGVRTDGSLLRTS